LSYILVLLYLAAIVLANLSVYWFGVNSVIVNSFLFIGLDLTTRDYLHKTWKTNIRLKMLILIFSGSLLSYILNQNVSSIAIASFVAFFVAGIVDTTIYTYLIKQSETKAINISNVFSALVDSVLFPLIAFGLPLMVGVVIGQFIAKVLGGYFWFLLIRRIKND